MKRLLLLSMLLCCSFAFSSTRLLDAVVDVKVVSAEYDYDSPWKSSSQARFRGSGFLIEGGYILTNAHVVQNQLFIEVKSQNGKTTYADLIAVSHVGDLALLALEDPTIMQGVTPLKIRNHMAELNEKILIVGFPSIGETLCVTEGKVIQTELDWYVHTFSDLLVHRVDARAFGGNSGGPVLAEGEVVGVLHQGTEDIHDIIPTPIVLHFLQEAGVGQVEGYPTFAYPFFNFYQEMRNPALRAYYQMHPDEEGALVRFIPENHFFSGSLFPGDIILSIDGYSINQDQMVELDNGVRVDLKYLIAQKFYGEWIDLMILREGKRFPLSIFVDPEKKGAPLIPRDRFDQPPTYYVNAGLVFQPIDSQFKDQFDQCDFSDRLDYYFYSGKVEDGRTELVVLTQILPDKVNEGYNCYPDIGIVDQVNGKKIRKMEDVIQAFDGHNGVYHHIVTESDYEIIIDVELAQIRNEKIMKRYGIPADRSCDLE